MNLFHFITCAFTVLFGISTAYADPSHEQTLLVEAFTTTGWKIQGESVAGTQEAQQHIDVQIYELDGIQRFEEQLSKSLPINPHQAKQVALKCIQKLDEQAMIAVKNTAVGLAKAMQYEIDRYPAIVFDGQAVVYGVTDVQTALTHYQAWRKEGKR